MAESKRLSVDERRAQLLELGLELFGLRSPEEVSIEAIAKAAGVSKGLLYHYFPSKREFWIATVRLAAAQLVEATEDQDPESTPALERLQGGLTRYLDYIAERADDYLTLMRSGTSDPQILEVIEGTRQVFIGRIIENLQIEEVSPILQLSLQTWIGSVEAACMAWLPERTVPREQLRDLLVAQLVSALGVAGATRTEDES